MSVLAHQASARVDLRALSQALVFTFAAGGAQEVFDDVVAGAKLPPTTWDRADFGRDVYLGRADDADDRRRLFRTQKPIAAGADRNRERGV